MAGTSIKVTVDDFPIDALPVKSITAPVLGDPLAELLSGREEDPRFGSFILMVAIMGLSEEDRVLLMSRATDKTPFSTVNPTISKTRAYYRFYRAVAKVRARMFFLIQRLDMRSFQLTPEVYDTVYQRIFH